MLRMLCLLLLVMLLLIGGRQFVACSPPVAPPPRLKHISSSSPRESYAQLRDLFEKGGRASLSEYTRSDDTSLALQASWELHKKLIHRTDAAKNDGIPRDTYDPKVMRGFFDFLSKRTSIGIPEWWSKSICNLRVRKDSFHMTVDKNIDKLTNVITIDNGDEWHVGKGVSKLQMDNKLLRITVANDAIAIPKPFSQLDPLEGNSLACITDDKMLYLSIYSKTAAGSYFVFGIDKFTGERKWKSIVWAMNRLTYVGTGANHFVEMRINKDTVFVFGEEAKGLYLEAFDLASGCCRFRFCTCYWGEYSEDWNIRE